MSIALEDETKLDTQRIQAAIDACPPGRAVVLRRASARTDAFLSGPLNLRRGVVLVVDRGAYLFASRNPRDYDRTPGVCGTITEDGHGCKALINGDDVPDSGVMGDGVIDGRGGETILGQNITWWNLADQARAGGSQNNPRLMVLNHCDNFVLYRITLMNSPNFHVGYRPGPRCGVRRRLHPRHGQSGKSTNLPPQAFFGSFCPIFRLGDRATVRPRCSILVRARSWSRMGL